MALRLEPAHQVMWIRDVFGNSIALVDWLEPADVLRIISDVTVDRIAPFPARGLHDPWRGPFPPQYDALETLRSTLALPAIPRRIECFDISTIQGSETVASMVVCEDGKMRKSEYRKYHRTHRMIIMSSKCRPRKSAGRF